MSTSRRSVLPIRVLPVLFRWAFAALLFLASYFAEPSHADGQSFELSRIAQAAYFRPTTEDFESDRRRAINAVADLDRYLGYGSNADAWKRFLKLQELNDQLLSIPVPTFSPIDFDDRDLQLTDTQQDYLDQFQTIRELAARMMGKHQGLERGPIASARESIKRLVLTSELMVDATLEKGFQSRRDEIVELLMSPHREDQTFYRTLQPLASWMDQYGQATEWTTAAKSLWSRPNLRINVSAAAMRQVTLRPIRETEPIEECEDGRRIHGRALVTGVAYMVPSESSQPISWGVGHSSADMTSWQARPQCQIVFDGNIESTLNGSDGPVSFGLIGHTRVNGYTPVILETDRFTVLPIQTSSSTRLRTRHVSTRRNGIGSRLVRKIATNVIEKKRPESQRELNKGAVERFSTAFMEDVTQEILEAEMDFKEDVLAALDRSDVRPSDLNFAGTGSHLEIGMTLNGGFGLGAPPLALPTVIPGLPIYSACSAPDITIRLHESVVERLAQRMLAGETISDFATLVQSIGLPLTDEQAAEMPDDILIELARDLPVTARFEENTLELTVRCKRFQVGRASPIAVNFTVRYDVHVDAGNVKFEMIGDPKVTPPETKRAGIRFYTMKNVVARRLKKEIPKENTLDGFDLDAPGDRLGHLNFDTANVSQGWITLTMRGAR
ncbi:MAG: hypothetical protein ACF8CQ_22730 [Rhodopirellula sp. JB044]|uniref:hypothetical protein n=1 Tax=Rhodopirellula sp. JB044 TaxID=3342844 RepID=UPI00370A412E